MDKNEWEDELTEAFAQFAATHFRSALILIAGLFVGMMEAAVSNEGGDPDRQVRLEGGDRIITLHARGAQDVVESEGGDHD